MHEWMVHVIHFYQYFVVVVATVSPSFAAVITIVDAVDRLQPL